MSASSSSSSSSSSDEDDESRVAVVMDNGTSMIRAGYAGDDGPILVWPNLMGTPKSEVQKWSLDLKDRYIGDEAQLERGRLALHYPMKGGQVTDWEAMEQVWEASFRELKANPATLPVLLSDRPLTPAPHRERMTETMFETFHVPQFYVMSQGVLAMFASGRGIAVVVDCGEGATTVMPIEELVVRPHAILRGSVSGADLTESLQASMMQRGYDVMGQDGLEVVREAKETLCFVAEDYDAELSRAQEKGSLDQRFELPSGQLATLNEDRIRVPEALFQPSLIGKEGDGIHKLVYKSIMKCDIDSRRHMYCNIIAAGASTFFPGFIERLQKELSALFPPTMKVRVVNPPERKYSSFIGGSIVSSLTVFQNCWITKEEYEEHGPIIVHKKCT